MNEYLDELAKRPAPAPPRGLRAGGRKLWAGVLTEFALRVDELTLLIEACRTRDLCDRMRAELASAETLAITGARGLPAPHPLLGELQKHESLLQRQLAGLGLRDASADPMAASNAGRALVGNRWRRGRA